MGAYTLSTTSWAESAGALTAIRRQVFILEQGVAEYEEWDAADLVASHVLALSEKRDAVGTGRLESSGKVGRVAVVSAHRGRGLGAQIMTRLLAEARRQGMERIHLNAQLPAERFYGQLGFEPVGPTFMEAGINHVRMELQLRSDRDAER